MKKENDTIKQIISLTQMSQRNAFKQPLTKYQEFLQINSERTQGCVYSSSRQNSQAKTIQSAASRTIYMRKKTSLVQDKSHKQQLNNPPRSNKQIQNQCDRSYEILDLTFTFITSQMNKILMGIIFALLLLIRYYTFGCLLYVMIANYTSHWKWIFVVFLNRFLYICIVIKISLKIPQNKTQLILKKNWNCMQSQVHQYFQVLNAKKLITSILRGLIPSQLSFLYIKSQTRMKMFQIYSAINFIYSGIQSIIYYPFFIIYMNYINSDNTYSLNVFKVNLTVVIALLAEIIMVCLTINFLGVGIYRRYGSMSSAIKQFLSYMCCKDRNIQNKDQK